MCIFRRARDLQVDTKNSARAAVAPLVIVQVSAPATCSFYLPVAALSPFSLLLRNSPAAATPFCSLHPALRALANVPAGSSRKRSISARQTPVRAIALGRPQSLRKTNFDDLYTPHTSNGTNPTSFSLIFCQSSFFVIFLFTIRTNHGKLFLNKNTMPKFGIKLEEKNEWQEK